MLTGNLCYYGNISSCETKIKETIIFIISKKTKEGNFQIVGDNY